MDTDNKIRMVEGKLFNWELKPVYAINNNKFYHSISFFGDGEHWGCHWQDGLLIISNMAYSSNTSISMTCDLDFAEKIVMSFVTANKYEIMPLFKK